MFCGGETGQESVRLGSCVIAALQASQRMHHPALGGQRCIIELGSRLEGMQCAKKVACRNRPASLFQEPNCVLCDQFRLLLEHSRAGYREAGEIRADLVSDTCIARACAKERPIEAGATVAGAADI